jgi:coproporphyrinogen III oxidase
MPTPLLDRAAQYFRELQDRIVAALEAIDGHRFREDSWQRPGGGGGRTRVLAEGALFEKAGVNFSDVHGELRSDLPGGLPGDGPRFRASGISLVLHPRSPHIPTVHANFRRIERGSAGWFGGGADLTPYYLDEADATHFHRTLKAASDRHDAGLYPRFKRWCDRYFFITHRGEPRGLGGMFFDYLGAGSERQAGEKPNDKAGDKANEKVAWPTSEIETDPERTFAFVRGVGDAFLDAYLPIVERHRNETWTPEERHWQLIRRGRYVEFNLVYDRGTVFGLKTDGRVESILMSLPNEARWEYAHEPSPGSREAVLAAALRAQRNWADG